MSKKFEFRPNAIRLFGIPVWDVFCKGDIIAFYPECYEDENGIRSRALAVTGWRTLEYYIFGCKVWTRHVFAGRNYDGGVGKFYKTGDGLDTLDVDQWRA